jgi:hypothetical protein
MLARDFAACAKTPRVRETLPYKAVEIEFEVREIPEGEYGFGHDYGLDQGLLLGGIQITIPPHSLEVVSQGEEVLVVGHNRVHSHPAKAALPRVVVLNSH